MAIRKVSPQKVSPKKSSPRKVSSKKSFPKKASSPVLPKNAICLDGFRFVAEKGCIKIKQPLSTVCREGYYIDKMGHCRKEKIVLQHQGPCREGLKMSKSGRCIKDASFKASDYGKVNKQRQTVCLEGFRISRSGACIRDKNYKITTQVPAGLTPAQAMAAASITKSATVGRLDGTQDDKTGVRDVPSYLQQAYGNTAKSIAKDISGEAVDEEEYSNAWASYKPAPAKKSWFGIFGEPDEALKSL